MRKKWMIAAGLAVGLLAFCGSAFSAQSISLIVNGKSIAPDVPPQVINGRTMVPVRWVSEALGARVDWNSKDHRVTVDLPNAASLERRVELLEDAIAPHSADDAVKKWAEAVKTRNGAVQFAVFSSSLQKQALHTFEEMNWVTGISSPWVESYSIKAGAGGSYNVTFKLATSTGSAGEGTVKVTVKQNDDKWFITGLKGESGSDNLEGIVIIPSAK